MSHDIPERAWEKIGCDLLSFRGKDYVVTVCYKSNFWELDRLNDTKSTTVIKKLKAHLARYGIPRQLVSDNGPQFVSSEFSSFTRSWGIEHNTTSPHHSKTNSNVESAVKVAEIRRRPIPCIAQHQECPNTRRRQQSSPASHG